MGREGRGVVAWGLRVSMLGGFLTVFFFSLFSVFCALLSLSLCLSHLVRSSVQVDQERLRGTMLYVFAT